MSKPVRRQGSAVYYAQRAVPKDLRQTLGNGPLWKTLGTKNLEEAKPLCRRQHDVWDALFSAERAKANAVPNPHTKSTGGPFVSPEQREQMQHAQDQWDADNRAFWEANPLPDYDELSPEDQKVRDAVEAAKERWDADRRGDLELLAEHLPNRTNGPLAPQDRKTEAGTPLGVVVERWAKGQTNQKTIDRMRQVVAWFEDDMGCLPVEAISPENVLDWSEKLAARVEATNARTKLANFNTLMRYAWSKARLIPTNPASGISIAVKRDPEDDIRPFDLPALRAIFSSPIYESDERPEAGAGEAAYWLPLLALFTGARLNELGQLRPKDIVELPYVDRAGEERSAWCIRIVADKADDLKLKNAYSARRLPIHPELVRLGFLRFVHLARQNAQARLFPDLRPDKYGHVTANWSKWFGRYLRATIRVADDRMRFHSFRHTFKDYVREAEIQEDVNDAFTGHRGKAVARTYGSSLNYPLRPMVTAMPTVRITGLTLPSPPPAFRDKAD